jgi:hypothetical protein
MTHKPKPHVKPAGPPAVASRPAKRPINRKSSSAAFDADQVGDEAGDAEENDIDDGHERILARPDGYYWLAPDGRQEIGPFDSLAEALADMDSGDAAGWAPGETLAEAESEIGVSDWIDPDSGALAEGHGPTHLERE